MNTKAAVILVLVVIAVLALMALGGGAYRDRRDGTQPPRSYDDPDAGVEAIESATGWLRSKFDRKRIVSECWTGDGFRFSGGCEVTIKPGSLRPSRFRLAAGSPGVSLCFAFDREKLAKCALNVGDLQMKELTDPSDFTVAKDSAFMVFRCSAGGGSGCVVKID